MALQPIVTHALQCTDGCWSCIEDIHLGPAMYTEFPGYSSHP